MIDMLSQIEIPQEKIAELCRQFSVRELALFGSVLRDDFSASSDVDLIVDFAPDAQIGFMAFSKMQRELEDLFNRPVDLVSKNGLNRRIRQTILDEARVIYAA